MSEMYLKVACRLDVSYYFLESVCRNWHHVHSRQVVSCPVQPRARHWSCVFWRDFSGVKRTCWTTGSWRSCLSLEVVSSIPAWSTIIYRFLCGFICVSLCQSIKIKPTNMCLNVCLFYKDYQFKIIEHGSYQNTVQYETILPTGKQKSKHNLTEALISQKIPNISPSPG